jgi:hypothetical protein
MKLIQPYANYIGQPSEDRVFLAGGITGAPLWQNEIAKELEDTDLVLFNPRQEKWPDDPRDQIEWEFRHLAMSDAVSFWFPYPAKCMITLYELGRWAASHKPIFVGVDPQYERKMDVEIQMSLARPGLQIAYSLSDLSKQIKAHFRKGKR